MDKDTEKYFETYFDLFASQGWKQFIEDIEENRTLVSDIQQIKDANDLYYRKGQLNALEKIVNLQDTIERTWKEVQSQ